MSMVSRRVFLKCLGVGSAAVASAALLGGCTGGAASSGSNSNSSNNGNHGNSNSGANSNSNSSSSSSSSASSDSTAVSGDVGKGVKYRCQWSDGPYNTPNIHSAGITLMTCRRVERLQTDDMDCINLFFYITNDKYTDETWVNIEIENIKDNFSLETRKDYARDPFASGLGYSKYMEASCGSRKLPLALTSGPVDDGSSILKPGMSSVALQVYCRVPKGWNSIDVRYTMPFDPKTYINFVVYPRDLNITAPDDVG